VAFGEQRHERAVAAADVEHGMTAGSLRHGFKGRGRKPAADEPTFFPRQSVEWLQAGFRHAGAIIHMQRFTVDRNRNGGRERVSRDAVKSQGIACNRKGP
jgi:hypothetical protein